MSHAISFFFSALTEGVILWQYSNSLFVPKRSVVVRASVLSGIYSFIFLIMLAQSVWANCFFYFCLNFSFFIAMYRLKWYMALFHTALITSFMTICEVVVYGVFKNFAPHFVSDDAAAPMMIFAVLNKLLFFTVIYLLIHVLKEDGKEQQNRVTLWFLMVPLCSALIMVVFICIGEHYSLIMPYSGLVSVCAVLLLIMNLLLFEMNQRVQAQNAEFTQLQLLHQKELDMASYYEMLRAQSENQRILIHDMKKHLQSIRLLNERQDYNKVDSYISQLIASSDLQETARMCDNDLLNSILCRYLQQCRQKHITFHADIRSGTMDGIAGCDLTAIFCNLLDNAVEAAQMAEEGYIEVMVCRREHTPFVVITMVNSCVCNPFPKGSPLPATHKENTALHGFGLKSVSKAIKRYQGEMQLYYDEQTATFHTVISLRDKEMS